MPERTARGPAGNMMPPHTITQALTAAGATARVVVAIAAEAEAVMGVEAATAGVAVEAIKRCAPSLDDSPAMPALTPAKR